MSDLHIRKQAIDPTQSYIVSAPAGSGKTSLLVQRYINLLCSVDRPEKVVAITFTRKAAAEMLCRVQEVLDLAKLDTQLNGHKGDNQRLARRLTKHAMQHNWKLTAQSLCILTIDALNNRLTQNAPLASGLGSEQDLCLTPTFDYKLAIQNFLYSTKSKPSDAAYATLLQHINNNLDLAARLLTQMLQTREQWLPYVFYRDPKNMRSALESGLYNYNQSALDNFKVHFSASVQAELLTLLRFASLHYENRLLDKNLQLPEITVEHIYIYKNICNTLLTKDNSWRKKVDTRQGFPTCSDDYSKQQCKAIKQDFISFVTKHADNKNLLNALVRIRHLPPAKYSEQQWQVLSALTTLLPELTAHLKVVFQQTNRIDYTERSLSAIYSLEQNQMGLSAQTDAEIQHILIDEFQDTSMAQHRLLLALTAHWDANDSKTLFCVGDPMQSIYRFRQADVNLFIDATKYGIGNLKLQHLTLRQNFRSDPLLIDWVNKHMQYAFTQNSPTIRFNPATCTRPDNKNSTINFTAHANTSDEAADIIKTIKSIRETDRSGKIAIIARTRRHLATIVPMLQQNNIAINAQELTPIAKQANIRYLHCLCAILLHPGDEIAWAGLLRSPIVGCTLKDLYTIKQATNLAELLNIIPHNLDEKLHARLSSVISILNDALLELTLLPLPDVTRITWNKLSGNQPWQQLTEAMDSYLGNLKTWLKTSHQQDIQEFAQLMQTTYINNISSDPAAIEIMTIHHAKGLEFEHVIIPGMANYNAASKNKLLYWREINYNNKQQLLLAPLSLTIDDNAIYQALRKAETEDEAAEITRVLYVAVTRARSSLHLFATLDTKDSCWVKPKCNSLLANIWELINCAAPARQTLKREDEATTPIIEFKLVRWKNDLCAKNLAYFSAVKKTQTHSAKIGTIIHEILQFFNINSIKFWQKPQLETYNYLQNLFRKHGLASSACAQAQTQIIACLHSIIADTRGQWIFNPQHSQVASELRICKQTSSGVETYIIDRTFIANGVRWIIDFKTTAAASSDINHKFLENQRELYSEQLANYATLFVHEGRPIMVGLYFPANPGQRWLAWQAYNPEDNSWAKKTESVAHSTID